MSNNKQFFGSISASSKVGLIVSLLGPVTLLGSVSVTTTSQAAPNEIPPAKTSYDCGAAGLITVMQEGNRNSDRYTYIGVNSRGQKLKIPHGVGYVKDSSETIYTFATKNDARFIIGDSHDGKAILSKSQGDGPSTTFNCTVSSQGTPGSNHS